MKRFWTSDEMDALVRRYPHERAGGIARDLGRPLHQVYGKASSMGLRKSAEFMASPATGFGCAKAAN